MGKLYCSLSRGLLRAQLYLVEPLFFCKGTLLGVLAYSKHVLLYSARIGEEEISLVLDVLTSC